MPGFTVNFARKSLPRAAMFSLSGIITLVFCLSFVPSVLAQTGANTSLTEDMLLGTPNRGWEGLAQALDALTPSVNTEKTRSGTEITDEIEMLISRGKAQAALDLIESREAQIAASTAPGTDVQLMFQKARALTALKRVDEAQAVYRDMTLRFPELAEPWNNLAIIYIQRGSLDEAEQALKTALMNNPEYGSAIGNLADVRLLMALRDYRRAAQMRVPGASQRLKSLESILQPGK